ncbi:DUF5344 family protein [Bacillus sp. CECT 9360]|uniref:DUF5344 family protein n=1 Tax=Bacillus sp. CECT 9360 TaxID=2845821 RepID=UPI001E3AB2FD|nr:DUF5344 family protein [Bacillus sp. CECT 9360]CAH0347270.1 hypothetical protein BCI9360_03661 [Bacillus sp. CECT 9360]
MSGEINLRIEAITEALANIKSAATNLETAYPTEVGPRNQLNVVSTMNEINRTMQQAMETYQRILLSNVDATVISAETLSRADEQVASTINNM